MQIVLSDPPAKLTTAREQQQALSDSGCFFVGLELLPRHRPLLSMANITELSHSFQTSFRTDNQSHLDSIFTKNMTEIR